MSLSETVELLEVTVLCFPSAAAVAVAAERSGLFVRSNSVVFKHNNFCLYMKNANIYNSTKKSKSRYSRFQHSSLPSSQNDTIKTSSHIGLRTVKQNIKCQKARVYAQICYAVFFSTSKFLIITYFFPEAASVKRLQSGSLILH